MDPPSASTGSPRQLVLEGAGRSYPLGADPLSIGRGSDNRVVVADEQVSPHHCALWRTESDCYVRDDSSIGGTWLNGRRVSGAAEVREGDVLRIGSQIFTVRAGGGLLGSEPPAARDAVGPVASAANGRGKARRLRPGAFSALVLLAAGIAILFIAGTGLLGRATAPAPTPTPGRLSPATTDPATGPPAAQDFAPILMATVRVTSPIDGTSSAMGGSGAIVSSRGHILTNFHVIGRLDTGVLYSGKGPMYVAVNTIHLDWAPELRYMAELVKSDRALDLALLRIVSMWDGAALPRDFALPWLAAGDPDALQIGDDLAIVGFPGLGAESVTLTRGTVSGFLSDGGLTRAWIKTDSEVSEGNSGGPAVNARGELIGITSGIRAASDSGKISYVRPVNLAMPLLSLITP